MSASAGIIESIAKALSAMRPARRNVISRAPAPRLLPGSLALVKGMSRRCWRSPRSHARACGMEREPDQRRTKRVRLIGLPTDSHSSFLRGAAAAPPAIRAALHSDHSNMGAESGEDVELDDAGDLPLDESAADVERIREAAASAVSDGVVPIFLGGDHMVTYPIVSGLAAERGPVAILHFDAHPDLYDDFEGDPLSHASPFARIMEKGLASRLVQ